MNRLAGKVAVVTGGGSGIGKAVTQLFANEGAKVAVWDVSEKNLYALEEEMRERGQELLSLKVNIVDSAEVKRAVESTVERYGKIDVLVTCAGIFRDGTIVDMSEEEWDTIMSVNVQGTYLCIRHVLPEMLDKKSGSIITIGSEAGRKGLAGQVAYNVSKAAVIHMTRSIAVDYATKNIRANCVCPGRIRTPLVDHIIDTSADPNATEKSLSEDRPMMHMGRPIDIAHACLSFAADEMLYATGAVLDVDGGASAS